MKVLIVSCVYPPEPIVSAQIGEALATTLAMQGNEVDVIAPFPSRPEGFRFEASLSKKNKAEVNRPFKNLTINRLPSFVYPKSNPIGRLLEGLSFGWKTYRYIVDNASNIDKVYMNTWPLFGQLGVAKACRKKGISYVVHIQDVYPESLTKKLPSFLSRIVFSLLYPIEKYITFGAARIIVISSKMKQHIAATRHIASNRIDVVLNWQDEKGFEAFKNIYPTNVEPIFMYLGNIGPVAGLSTVIKAFITANVKAKLVLAGSGSRKESCMALAQGHPAIEFWDVPTGAVAETQAKSSVLILPIIKGAASSSIPSKLPAYMFSSRPIIVLADEDSDTSNAVISANCGWAGAAEDEQWLIETFREVANIPDEELRLLGVNGYAYGVKNFSKEINLTKLTSIINEVQ